MKLSKILADTITDSQRIDDDQEGRPQQTSLTNDSYVSGMKSEANKPRLLPDLGMKKEG